jgi:hypothetical protein
VPDAAWRLAVRVKGTAIVDLVKMIRSQPDRDWDRYLLPDDLAIAKGIVLPTSYYPGESFWRMSWAVFDAIGGGSLDNAVLFGRTSAVSYLKVYTRFLVEGDPGRTIANFANVWQTFYDFEGEPYEKMRVDQAPGRVRVVVDDYPGMTIPDMRTPYFHGLAGYFQELAEHANGGKRVHVTISDRGDSFELTLSWS